MQIHTNVFTFKIWKKYCNWDIIYNTKYGHSATHTRPRALTCRKKTWARQAKHIGAHSKGGITQQVTNKDKDNNKQSTSSKTSEQIKDVSDPQKQQHAMDEPINVIEWHGVRRQVQRNICKNVDTWWTQRNNEWKWGDASQNQWTNGMERGDKHSKAFARMWTCGETRKRCHWMNGMEWGDALWNQRMNSIEWWDKEQSDCDMNVDTWYWRCVANALGERRLLAICDACCLFSEIETKRLSLFAEMHSSLLKLKAPLMPVVYQNMLWGHAESTCTKGFGGTPLQFFFSSFTR